MLSTEIKTNIDLIKDGQWNASLQSYFEQLSAKSLVNELIADHPIVFQERQIGRKREIGIAGEIVFELRFRKVPKSLFSGGYLLPLFRHCFLISSYDDTLSEITWINRIRVKPKDRDGDYLTLSFGRGIKVDKTVDGWCNKPLPSRGTPLSKEVLKKHGWQFDVLQPFGLHGLTQKP